LQVLDIVPDGEPGGSPKQLHRMVNFRWRVSIVHWHRNNTCSKTSQIVDDLSWPIWHESGTPVARRWSAQEETHHAIIRRLLNLLFSQSRTKDRIGRAVAG
jgi:hypothetical protein